MIIDLGPNDGIVMVRIEFISVHREHLDRKFIIERSLIKGNVVPGGPLGLKRPVIRKLL